MIRIRSETHVYECLHLVCKLSTFSKFTLSNKMVHYTNSVIKLCRKMLTMAGSMWLSVFFVSSSLSLGWFWSNCTCTQTQAV